MTPERWKEAKGTIKEKFEVLLDVVEPIDEDSPGTVEIIEFLGPLGKMRLEWTDQPLVVNKKVLTSRRIGAASKVEYTYSETERVHKLMVFRWNDATNDWDEMAIERQGFFI